MNRNAEEIIASGVIGIAISIAVGLFVGFAIGMRGLL